MDVLNAWNRIALVREFSFKAHSRAVQNTGWSGAGTGVVKVERVGQDIVRFDERGTWSQDSGLQINFTNVFKWTFDPSAGSIRLEHLRFGPDKPVYLFLLVPVDERTLKSSEPHVCNTDLYEARLELQSDCVLLDWTINGPNKNESISYVYK